MDTILAAGTELLSVDGARLDGVTTVGVDEHVWGHTRHGDRYVTRHHRLYPDKDEDRSIEVVGGGREQIETGLKSWLEAQAEAFWERVEIVTMDGFTGYKPDDPIMALLDQL